MYQHFTPGLTRHDIYLQGRELATMGGRDQDEHGQRIVDFPDSEKELVASLNNPVLASDYSKIVHEIRDYIQQQTAIALIGKDKKTTHFDGTELTFDQSLYPGLRGPNIDTVVFADGLRKMDLSTIESGCEVGCGPGFDSMYVMDHAPQIKSRDMYDIEDDAQKFFDDHFGTHDRYDAASIHIGDAKETIQGKTYDLIICNPPYIPRENAIEDNPYEGLELLIYLIENRKTLLNPGGKLVVNISSLSEKVLTPYLYEHEDKLQSDILTTKQVPLKVYNVLNNKRWLNYLIENHNLQHLPHDGHDYRQRISIIEIAR